MGYSTETFSGTIGVASSTYDITTIGTFTATLIENATGSLSGTWSYSGTYNVPAHLNYPALWTGPAQGNVSFSGTLSQVVATGSTGYSNPAYTFNYASTGSGWLTADAAGLLWLHTVDGTATLAASVGFNIQQFGQDYFDAGSELNANINSASTLPPVVSIDTYPANVAANAQSVSLTLSRWGADLTQASTVQVLTEEGSAHSSAITATFGPNVTSISVTVPIVSGGGLSFEIVLTNPVNASLGFDKGDVSMVISNGISVASAIASYTANQITSSATVSDSALNVANNLDTLQNMATAGKLGSVTLTDSGTPTLTITPVQAANDATALGLISGSYHVAVTGRAFDVGNNLNALQSLAGTSKLSAVTFTDASTPTLTLSSSQEAVDAAALDDISGACNISIVGDAGINTVVYTQGKGNYAITHQSDGTFTVAQPTGTGRTDTLISIERIQFSDAKVALDISGNPNACFNTTGLADAGQVYRLYQATFNRTPDKGGLAYWIWQADSGVPLTTIAAGFTGSVEFKNTYGSITDHQFVDQLYLNVLHRQGESAGTAWWYGELDTHAMTREQVLVGFSDSTENQAALIGVIHNGIDYTT